MWVCCVKLNRQSNPGVPAVSLISQDDPSLAYHTFVMLHGLRIPVAFVVELGVNVGVAAATNAPIVLFKTVSLNERDLFRSPDTEI